MTVGAVTRLIASWSDRRTFRHRLVKPLAFWVGVANLIIVSTVLRNVAIGTLLNGLPGHLIAALGTFAVVLMLLGWWLRRPGWLTSGLLLTSAFWWSLFAVIVVVEQSWLSASGWLCVPWAGLTAWAWWIEVGDA